jgi:hypothetical protein
VKYFFIIIIPLLALFFSSYASHHLQISQISIACDQVPELNQKIIDFVKANLNKKVGEGECWDLAAKALNKSGAKWDNHYAFGKEVDIRQECIYPGDIMQFEGVEIKYEKKGVFYREELEHHTAIIFKVNGKENFIMAEQNTNTLGKKVGLNPLELKNILKGNYTIFRPVK